MIWSISSHIQFPKCQRQWYYKNKVADARVKKDAYRQEVTILSKLKSIDAWRGGLVDEMISQRIVPALAKKAYLSKEQILQEAMSMFNRQLSFAKSKKYRSQGFSYSKESDFAALFVYDRDLEFEPSQLEQAREDVLVALTHLLDNKELLDYLRSARRLIVQRALNYSFDQFTVRGYPDLIAFFDKQPPHIVDWKVHSMGTKAYDEQLLAYAMALHKVSPHIDFPPNLAEYPLTSYRLTEYQLLLNEKREYEISEERIEEMEDLIASSILAMYMAGAHKKYTDLTPYQFSTTLYPENCLACPFTQLCKQHDHETPS